jgi:hypothetical protein
MKGPMSTVEILEAGIRALADADADQLGMLADAARQTKGPQTAEEQEMARVGLRTLGYLITLTRRNLRLLRGASSGANSLGQGSIRRDGTEAFMESETVSQRKTDGAPAPTITKIGGSEEFRMSGIANRGN